MDVSDRPRPSSSQIQFWNGHPPEKKGAVLATHGVPHNFLLSVNYWCVPKMEGVSRGLRRLLWAGEKAVGALTALSSHSLSLFCG